MFLVLASKLAGLSQRLAAARLAGWYRSHVTYRELMGLDDRQLADIGLARSDIERVALIGRAPAVRAAAGRSPAANFNRPTHAA